MSLTVREAPNTVFFASRPIFYYDICLRVSCIYKSMKATFVAAIRLKFCIFKPVKYVIYNNAPMF